MTTETSSNFAQSHGHLNNSGGSPSCHFTNEHYQVPNPSNITSSSAIPHQLTNGGSQRRQNSESRSPSASVRKSSPSSSLTSAGDGPLAILTPCSNSHPFEERCIPVTCGDEQHPIKIGRAVVRFQPAYNNAIFDCKVLSRNHAVLWYSDGQFYIKDTRSSNGTFINGERLSGSGEDSDAYPLYSGDILQLGVEIVDNAKKVASGCVTCIVTLKNDRGEECQRPSSAENGAAAAAATLAANGGAAPPTINDESTSHSSSRSVVSIERMLLENEQFALKYTLVPNNKLFIMNQYMKEARFRENNLGMKLQSLEEQLAAAQEALESSWQALINEEHLLSRIEILESQLALYAATSKPHGNGIQAKPSKNRCKNDTIATEESKKGDNKNSSNMEKSPEMKDNDIQEDKAPKVHKIRPFNDEIIRDEIQEIYEDRAKAELAAKDALRKAEEEVFESTMRLHDVENSLLNVENENMLLRRQCEDYEAELQRQRTTLDEALSDVGNMREEKSKQAEEMAKLHSEIGALREQIALKSVENEQMIVRLAEMAERDEKQICPPNLSDNSSETNNPITDVPVGDESNIDYEAPGRDECQDENDENNLQVVQSASDNAANTYSDDHQNMSSVIPDGNDGRCACGRIMSEPSAGRQSKIIPRLSPSASIQILLFSTLPFMVLVFALIFPFFHFWPSGNCDTSTSHQDTTDDSAATTVVQNGTATQGSDL